MPASITFTVSNGTVQHQITLTRHAHMIVAMVDGIEYFLYDPRARKDGKALVGGGFMAIIAQITLTVSMSGHLRFSGIVTETVSRQIIQFVQRCGLPEI